MHPICLLTFHTFPVPGVPSPYSHTHHLQVSSPLRAHSSSHLPDLFILSGSPPTMLEGCPLKLCTHIISRPPWPSERSNPTPHVTDKETGAPRVRCLSKVVRTECRHGRPRASCSEAAEPSVLPASLLPQCPRCLSYPLLLSPTVTRAQSRAGTREDPTNACLTQCCTGTTKEDTCCLLLQCCQFSLSKTGTRTF